MNSFWVWVLLHRCLFYERPMRQKEINLSWKTKTRQTSSCISIWRLPYPWGKWLTNLVRHLPMHHPHLYTIYSKNVVQYGHFGSKRAICSILWENRATINQKRQNKVNVLWKSKALQTRRRQYKINFSWKVTLVIINLDEAKQSLS